MITLTYFMVKRRLIIISLFHYHRSEDHEYNNELYEMNAADSTLEKCSIDRLSVNGCDDLEYNTMYVESKEAVENDYATVRTFPHPYVKQ